jgi:N-acetylglucosaminyl-diphospho-decaprenol L-rhamnosyltransferase
MEPRIEPVAISQQVVPGLVSILIVNWNDLKYLEGCLRSIREKIAWPHEVILLDNGSADDSAAFVEREFPEVRLVRSDVNLGFIRATNLASKHAGGEFFLLLNPDTILQTDIASGVRLLQADGSIGAVGAKALGGDGLPRSNCGHYPSALRLALIRSVFWNPYRGSYGPKEFGAKKVDWVEGSWLLTPSSAWKMAGGLDERLFLYGDDVHYCRRLKELGLISVQMPSLLYIHFGGFAHRRQAYLYAGFRWFHAKFSGRVHRRTAEIVMKLGLRSRVAVFSLLALILRNPKYADRRRSTQRVLDVWDQMEQPRARFE